MPANPDNPRLKPFKVEDADALIKSLNTTLSRLKGLREALQRSERKSVDADGRVMAEHGLKRLNLFIGNCITKASLEE